MAKQKEKNLKREASDEKKKIVADLVAKMKKCKTLLVASTKGLPSSQFHEIKKNLRGKAEIRVVKKTAVIRAMEDSGINAMKELEKSVGADVALFFSEIDAFELSGLLGDNQSPTKAKGGDIAPEDIVIEPGPTDLLPGPAISELSGVGLKVAVEGGKLAIKIGKTVANKGDAIKDNVAAVLSKLGILPMKVGFEPVPAYDKESGKVYVGIKIDKKGVLEELRNSIAKSAGFAINLKYVTSNNIGFFIAKAGLEEKAVEKLINKSQQPQGG